jgi:uncharacterized protein YpmB
MNKKNLKIIIILTVIVLIITITLYCIAKKNNKKVENPTANNETTIMESEIKKVDEFIGELSDGTKINTNSAMNVASTLGNLQIENIRLTLKNGITTFRASVKNSGTTKTELKNVTLILKDKDGKELVSAKGLISSLNADESKELAISITSNYIDACGYEIVED